ncbi:hypothetical protein B0T26DRAFT_691020 [Lasiosphaeria miniovina]|uniref:Secreted protein n=1 Tax=Lasiosphaeria miniovina TaxID=1954250 RepID=A0AA40ECP6_9PEZI|nr:uncharacterized protein B0T26DRAFT_691020 [Lasiosphaeria miniovina]KAK0735170.1 hypothetical protein B0T26DRAFT_691020 [Lasiosphaeria miniovina]
MELVYGAKTVRPSEKVGTLPAPALQFNHQPLNGWVHEPENWGPSQLVAAVAAQVVRRTRGRGSAEQVVLSEGSVVDITNLTTPSGVVNWSPPASPAGQQWVVLAFYQRFSNERSCTTTAGASTWIGNGSWVVDHFSAAGAKKATDFWDQHLLDDPEIDGLLGNVGMYSWEDSMEMMAPLWWTSDFLARFEKGRGYSAVKSLPVFFQAKNLWNSYGEPYDTSYSFDGQPSDGGKYAEDYRTTLNEGYQDFLRQYQKWASARGMEHSAQPAYNMPLDMSSTVPLVGAPELESLGFGESIESYRQFTGPAHLFGRTPISTEIGAERGGAYAQTVPGLLNLFRDSFAAGVNTLVVHGFAYGGPYPGTTWPGYTPFQYEFCEMWGPRQPAWRHLNDSLLYAARNSEVLKTGVPKVDLVFYQWKHPWTSRPIYPKSDLNEAGYTYEYLGPENLASTDAPVKKGIFAPDGPGYKAIVLYGQTKITPSASAALLRFAQAGLPIFVVGPAPNTTIGVSGQEMVTQNMAKLVGGSFPSVKVVSVQAFGSGVLQDAGVLPRVTAEALDGANNATQIYTHWRSRTDGNGRLELAYLLNRGPATTFSLAFAVSEKAVPFVLDAWTGEQTRLLTYLRTSDSITARLSLAQQQSAILAFVTPSGGGVDGDGVPLYVVSRSPNVERLSTDKDGHIEGLISDGGEASVLLSDNREIDIPALAGADSPSLPATTLGPWNLTVESFAATASLSTSSVSANKTAIKVASALATLVPWTRIAGLERASGVGRYRTTFTLPPRPSNGTELAYTLHFTGRVLNTIRVRVNGVLVPAIDVAAPGHGRDITGLLLLDDDGGQAARSNEAKMGTSLDDGMRRRPSDGAEVGAGGRTNEVEVEVASTLFNAVKARMGDLRSIGLPVHVPHDYDQVPYSQFGLLGEVVIRTWRKVALS